MSIETDILHSLSHLTIRDTQGKSSQKQIHEPLFHEVTSYPQQAHQEHRWKKVGSTDAALVAQATLIDVHSISPSPISLLVQPSVSFISKQCAFKKILDSAYRSQNAVDVLIANFSKISSFFQGDHGYTHLLANIKLLLDQAKHLSKATPKDIRLLLEAAFINGPINGGLTVSECYHLSAQMLFLGSTPLPDISLQALYEGAKRETTSRISSLKREYQHSIDLFKRLGIYREELLRATALPLAIAKAILLPNGQLNIGIISDVKDIFLEGKEHRDSSEKHIASLLQEFSSDKKLQQAIETIAPPTGVLGARLINASLMRPHGTEVSLYDTHLVCLAACLTYWRQNNVGSCVFDSLLQEKQANGLRWLINDFKELLSKGYLTRQLHDAEIRFLGLPIPENLALDTTLKDPAILAGSPLESCIQAHLRIDPTEWDSMLQKNPRSLRDLFFSLIRNFPSKVSEDDLDQTLLLVESPSQAPLLRVVENALGSTFYPPCSPYKKPFLKGQKNIFRDLFNTLEQATRKSSLPELLLKIHEFRDFLELDGQTSTMTNPPTGTALAPFERVRMFWIPSPAYDDTLASVSGIPGACAHFLEDGETLQPVSKKEFTIFLFKLFQDLFREVYGQNPLPSSITLDAFAPGGSNALGALCIDTKGMPDCLPAFERSYPRLPNQERGPLQMTNRGFLQWLHRLGASQKTDISLLAASRTHGFRLLPTLPPIGGEAIFSLADSLLALDETTNKTIEEGFQRIPRKVQKALVDEYVARCARDVHIPLPGLTFKKSFTSSEIYLCQTTVQLQLNTCSFSIQECCSIIPRIVRSVIAESLLTLVSPSSPIRMKPLEWIQDNMQLSDSVDHFLCGIYSEARCPPLSSVFPQMDKDPLFRIEDLSSEFMRIRLSELPDLPTTLSKLCTAINGLVDRACQYVTFMYGPTIKTLRCTPSEIQLIQHIVTRKIRLDAQDRGITVQDIIWLVERHIKEEIIQTIRASHWGRDSFGIRKLPFNMLFKSIQMSLQISDIHYQCIMSLSESNPRYRDLLIHFADTNWGRLVSGKFLSIHYCLWYDPIDDSWPIVTAPETGEWHDLSKVSQMQLSDIVLVDSPHHPIEEAKRKESLTQMRKTKKKKQELERAFANSLSMFQQRFIELNTEQQQQILLHPILPSLTTEPKPPMIQARTLLASETPKDLPGALQRCREIVAVYQALQKSAPESQK